MHTLNDQAYKMPWKDRYEYLAHSICEILWKDKDENGLWRKNPKKPRTLDMIEEIVDVLQNHGFCLPELVKKTWPFCLEKYPPDDLDELVEPLGKRPPQR